MTDKKQTTKWPDVVAGFEKAVELCDLMRNVGHNTYTVKQVADWVDVAGHEVDRRLLKIRKPKLGQTNFCFEVTAVRIAAGEDLPSALTGLARLCQLGLRITRAHKPTRKGLPPDVAEAVQAELVGIAASMPLPERPEPPPDDLPLSGVLIPPGALAVAARRL